MVLLIAAIAATAAITYAVARNTNAPSATPPPAPTVQAPQFSAAEQTAAKEHVCQVFDTATRGSMSQGPMRVNGEPNLLVVVRSMNSATAVQNALNPAVPADVTKGARNYVDAVIAATTGATNNMPTDEFNRLNSTANDATYALADLCGLPH